MLSLDPTFDLARSLKSVLTSRIFLSPPPLKIHVNQSFPSKYRFIFLPGLCVAFSNDPIFDFAFHVSFWLRICIGKRMKRGWIIYGIIYGRSIKVQGSSRGGKSSFAARVTIFYCEEIQPFLITTQENYSLWQTQLF